MALSGRGKALTVVATAMVVLGGAVGVLALTGNADKIPASTGSSSPRRRAR